MRSYHFSATPFVACRNEGMIVHAVSLVWDGMYYISQFATLISASESELSIHQEKQVQIMH